MADSPEMTTRTVSFGDGEALLFRKYTLKVLESAGDPRPGSRLVGDKRRITLGSAPGCDVVLPDKGVSRMHAEILVAKDGYVVRDLGSKNGTYLDGNRIEGAWLRNGCVLSFGATQLEFSEAEEDVRVDLWPEERFGAVIGTSLEMRALFHRIDAVAAQDVTVLIEGESGTGKEGVAAELHAHSTRAAEPYVIFDCTAVPENLAESELFGHVKGAFTGATADRPGAFRSADGGTLFMDEVGELPLELQPKFLRILETQEFRPLGATDTAKVNVRVVAATNRNLAEEVRKGRFRQDLYYRLNVVRLEVPPLRRRREDIPPLVRHFLEIADDADIPLPPDVIEMLLNHSWPGNVRELRNFVERYRLLLPEDVRGAAELLERGRERALEDETTSIFRFDLPFKEAKGIVVGKFEVEYLRRLLRRHKGNVTASARTAGIHRKYLEELVRKHGLK